MPFEPAHELGHLFIASEEQMRLVDVERPQPGVGVLQRL